MDISLKYWRSARINLMEGKIQRLLFLLYFLLFFLFFFLILGGGINVLRRSRSGDSTLCPPSAEARIQQYPEKDEITIMQPEIFDVQ